MIEGHPFLFQDKRGTVYPVAEKGVEVVQSWSSEETIVAFVDDDTGDYEPDDILIHHTVQLIVAASPQGAFKKWTNQTGHASVVTRLAIKPWSREEFLMTGFVLVSLSTLD